MLSVLVANTKGGCGKTTIATQLAAAFAQAGFAAGLADADRQRSALDWAGRRPPDLPRVRSMDWSKEIDSPPKGIERLVIDCPAALKMKQVDALVRMADVIILPVLPSAFDEGAAKRFLAKLDELKPIRKNRKPVAVVGNRLRPRSRAAARLDVFFDGVGHKVVARLRDSALYTEATSDGRSIFDLNSRRAVGPREDWAPLLTYIEAEG